MSKDGMRRYSSPSRQRQAIETGQRITKAAKKLFLARGFEATTIALIAEDSGVAASTIYARYKSKAGVMLALVDDARFGDKYLALIETARQTADARDRLKVSARIARQVYEAEGATFDLAQSAANHDPSLVRLLADREAMRRKPQAALIRDLHTQGHLRPNLDAERAADIMWSLTSREVFRLLVVGCQWSPLEYERWLETVLLREICDR